MLKQTNESELIGLVESGDDGLKERPEHFGIKIPIPLFFVGLISLPLAAFSFCIGWTIKYNFEAGTNTHCHVDNYLPSISAAIDFQPQGSVWQLAIGFHFPGRLLAILMYWKYYWWALYPKYLKAAGVLCALLFIENVSLLGLSFFTSDEYFEWHKCFFAAFLLTSEVYICLSLWTNAFWRKSRMSSCEKLSFRLKKRIGVVNWIACVLALICYDRHMRYCQPMMYTWFCAFEYVVVVTNVLFHGLAGMYLCGLMTLLFCCVTLFSTFALAEVYTGLDQFRPGLMNIFVPSSEVKKLLGIPAELYYVRNGISNDNALAFVLPIPLHVDWMDFVVKGQLESPVEYSYKFNVEPVPVPVVGLGPSKATIHPSLNVTQRGEIFSHEETVRMSVLCPKPIVAPGTIYPFSLVLNMYSKNSNLSNALVFHLEKFCRIPTLMNDERMRQQGNDVAAVSSEPLAFMAGVYFLVGLLVVVVILSCFVSCFISCMARKAKQNKKDAVTASNNGIAEQQQHLQFPGESRSSAGRTGAVESGSDVTSSVHPTSALGDVSIAPGSSTHTEQVLHPMSTEREILETLVEKCGLLMINREALKVKDLLMSGTFGQVWTAVVDISAVGSQFGPFMGFRRVYIKTVTEEASLSQALLMVREGVTFADLQNLEPRVTNSGVFHELRGLIWDSGPPVLVYDFPALGNLKKFLISCRTGVPNVPRHTAMSSVDCVSESCRNLDDCSEATEIDSVSARSFSTHGIVSISLQVLSAITFLHERNVTHGDIAARNCVMDEDMRVKLCDTALSRDLFPSDYHCLGDNENRPVRWMAYESIVRHELHPPSDIWSFGVFLWELNTLAQVPYGDVDPFEMPNYLRAGYRLPQPVNCPDQLYQMMKYCWVMKHAERPTCIQLLVSLETFLKTLHAYV